MLMFCVRVNICLFDVLIVIILVENKFNKSIQLSRLLFKGFSGKV